MNIVDRFASAAAAHPHNIALVHKNKALTYAQLLQKVQECSAALEQAGIQSGDNVMLMIPFSIDLYIKILALFYLGARVVLVDAIKDKNRVVAAFNKAECKAILTIPLLYRLRYFMFARPLWGRLLNLNAAQTQVLTAKQVDVEETALISFTTGSTGHPKAANRTHAFLNIQLETLIKEMKLGANDVHISSLPVVLMCNLAVGATSVIPPKDHFLQRHFWKRIQLNHPPNVVSASPYHVSCFIHYLDTSHFNKVFVGGASILPHFVKEISEKISPEKIEFVYGSTEAEPIASITASDYLNALNEAESGIAVGKPHENLKVLIGKVEPGTLEVLNEGAIGEILVAGKHVLADYYKDKDAFEKNKVTHNGIIWHRTGDAGKFKNDQLYFYGRLKYTWIENGILQSPTCFENWLSYHAPQIEATVLCINNKKYVFYAGNEKQNLKSFLTFEIDHWIRIKKLPRDNRHLSRIDYEQLIELVINS